jgi:hypothetical protein
VSGIGERPAISSARTLCVSIALLVAVSTPACAANDWPATQGSALTFTGQVRHPHEVTLQELQRLPATSVRISFVTGHGAEAGTFTGALLWRILNDAVLIDSPGKNASLRHTVIVTARDGYSVALSLGELDPDFEGKEVILAYLKDGSRLGAPDGIRLIVPSDRHGGRTVRDVVTIAVN